MPKRQRVTGASADASRYARHRAAAARRQREIAAAGRDIGQLPSVADAARRAAAAKDFRAFCEQYLPQTFHLPWSPDHLKVIAKIEQAVLEGGLFAMAMPRGSGKTTLCETACLWALLYGHREFVALIGSDEEHAEKMLDAIKAELETNDLLFADFPEAVYPIRCLDGIHHRALGQQYRGRATRIVWRAKEISLPIIGGSPASGAVVRVAGITGRIRGMKVTRPGGGSIRPSLVLIDDPQTDASAMSVSQSLERERILNGAILGLAGPGRKIAGLMTLTVVRPDDLADRILDPIKNPQWRGERTKMVYAWPTNDALWSQYDEIWRESVRAGHGGREATEFYRINREAMDAGAVVSWPERYHPDEISAVQHARNLLLERGEAAFAAEYQNTPLRPDTQDAPSLVASELAARVGDLRRGEVDANATILTAFVDVHDTLLYWSVVAWSPTYAGWVIDYGAYPDQRRRVFTLRQARPTLADVSPGASREGAIYAGLQAVADLLLAREYRRTDGTMMRISRCLVDSGYVPDTVYTFCRHSPHSAILTPSRGVGLGPSARPMSEYRRRPGEQLGQHWLMTRVGRRALAYVRIDVYWWRSFLRSRLVCSPGEPGALLLYHAPPEHHRLIAEHLTAEIPVRVTDDGRTVEEWRMRPYASDNHWSDCLVGCAVAASICGASLPGSEPEVRRPGRRRVSYAERYARWREQRP